MHSEYKKLEKGDCPSEPGNPLDGGRAAAARLRLRRDSDVSQSRSTTKVIKDSDWGQGPFGCMRYVSSCWVYHQSRYRCQTRSSAEARSSATRPGEQ